MYQVRFVPRELGSPRYPFAQALAGVWQEGQIQTTTAIFDPAACYLLPPCTPTKIIGVGKNYRDHAAEMGGPVPTDPLIFLKPPSALLAPDQPIQLPAIAQRVDYEGELAVVIGKTCTGITPETAHHYIAGYTCANDVTARDLQKKDGQWTRAKGFDSFCPLGPFLWTGALAIETRLQTHLNGRLVQSASIQDMVFAPDYLVAYISQVMTLYPGDVILTGTPAGIGPLQTGDQVTVSLGVIGSLTNGVA
ncbi:fumarylacetoacetate hydrolase family protein [Candidatus Cyanaurora vandensis]|uniref:fumarylacetoacetate hydrolase family protein n=1 Tax=Candidatus Cyanaurora vandensis TaxID=2714958 RepID=UPI0025794A80|nr:fumarylacetoacetate hydrolase family protein [Candidatus Cyanaurora vandensis]